MRDNWIVCDSCGKRVPMLHVVGLPSGWRPVEVTMRGTYNDDRLNRSTGEVCSKSCAIIHAAQLCANIIGLGDTTHKAIVHAMLDKRLIVPQVVMAAEAARVDHPAREGDAKDA